MNLVCLLLTFRILEMIGVSTLLAVCDANSNKSDMGLIVQAYGKYFFFFFSKSNVSQAMWPGVPKKIWQFVEELL